MPNPDALTDEEKAELWAAGVLVWKLREHQLALYHAIASGAQHLKLVLKCARRFGKTFTTLLYLCEQAIRRPGLRMRLAAPTEKSLRSYVRPNMRQLLADCPRHLRPQWTTQESCYVWPNGSELHLAGTDKEHAEKLRGPGTDIGVCDEAGAMDNLAYVVNDILLPSTLDNEGRLIVISTPSKTPDHDFFHMCEEARAEGALVVKTVDDNTWLTSRPLLLAKYVKASGGEASSTWRREYKGEDVVDEEQAIIAEATEECLRTVAVEWPRAKHYVALDVMDVGFSPSNTHVLACWYDFLTSRLVVENERELRRMSTDKLVSTVKELDAETWGEHPVKYRWSDIEPILLNDLATMHKLYFIPTDKDLLDAMVNKVRVWFREDRIRINPRCRILLGALRAGLWNKSRTDFAYSSRFGHYDAIASLVYAVRNAPVHENPYPALPEGVTHYTHHIRPGAGEKKSETARTFEQAFGRRRG